MRIENLRAEKGQQERKRVCATVIWEDCQRPVHELYFETDAEFENDLTVNPHGFLIAGLMPAMWHNEQRIFIDQEICPQLGDGLKTAMTLNRHWWYSKDKALPRIEARTSSDRLFTDNERRAGMFFSGGIDSLASLRKNRMLFPLQHVFRMQPQPLLLCN